MLCRSSAEQFGPATNIQEQLQMYDAQWEAELIARVEAALPIDDLVGWLLREYPGSSEQDVLTMVHKVYDRDYKIAPSSPELRSFEVGNNTWQACPQRVERA